MDDNKQLLKKFIDGSCTEQEQQVVRRLLDTSEGKALLYKVMTEAEEDNPILNQKGDVSEKVQEWKKNVFKRIAADEESMHRPVRKLNILRYAAVWAGILFVSGLVFWQLKKTSVSDTELVFVTKTNKQGAPVIHVLPDSTAVYLAAGSTISYPENYATNVRDVNLKGEAFFDVTQDAARPFTIHTGDIQTRVLGTSFKVSAFEGETVQVAVATGKVGVSKHAASQKKELAALTPGMKLEVDPKTGRNSVVEIDVYTLEQWKEGDMVFDQQPLSIVAAELQRRYGITIHCADAETAAYRVSGTFPANETVAQVIKVLSVLGQFNYEVRKDQTYYLYKTDLHMQKEK